MEIRFEQGERKKKRTPEMRMYDPTGRGRDGADDAPVPVRLHAETDDTALPIPRGGVRFSDMSKIMILIAVFFVAMTALISLFGAAEYAQIISDIAAVESDMETYEQQISQVRKTQSSMNNYASINDACLDRGMQMIWEPEGVGNP